MYVLQTNAIYHDFLLTRNPPGIDIIHPPSRRTGCTYIFCQNPDLFFSVGATAARFRISRSQAERPGPTGSFRFQASQDYFCSTLGPWERNSIESSTKKIQQDPKRIDLPQCSWKMKFEMLSQYKASFWFKTELQYTVWLSRRGSLQRIETCGWLRHMYIPWNEAT
jgi:hypothetical protein